MTAPDHGDLDPALLRTHGVQLLDWLATYLSPGPDGAERFPVLARVRPGEIRAALPSTPPMHAESLDAILADVERVLIPGTTHWNHPGFFAYFAISSSVPGILGELLAAGLDTNQMLWRTAPAATELEEVTLDWLRQLVGLRTQWFGQIVDTASVAVMHALACAREAAGFDVRERGLAGRSDVPTLRVYCSAHTHSSVDKAMIALGLGHANLVKIPVDGAFRVRVDALRAAIAADRAAGMRPIAIVGTVGTTSTTSVDPIAALADVASESGCWLHVDAAYGGSAAVVPELRYLLDGTDRADSLVINPHKWLFTPVDCTAFYVRDRALLKRAFSLVADYLVTPEQDAATNYMDYGVQLGRRNRALKLWMVLRAFGAEGLAERIRAHCDLARDFAGMVHYAGDWEVCAPVPLALVCFRYAPDGVDEGTRDRWNLDIMARVNAEGRSYLSHTMLDGRVVLRLAVGNIRTERRHVEQCWVSLRAAAAVVHAAG
ncbi:MAG: pyridoxal-dependent decarboxylase [Gemmatimonadaceae bacterium]|nr:pyridoxal-dependent decarboxylase [Gemmatimonadaceae bacterium]